MFRTYTSREDAAREADRLVTEWMREALAKVAAKQAALQTGVFPR